MKKTYNVYSGIQIKVTSTVKNLGEVIEAYDSYEKLKNLMKGY